MHKFQGYLLLAGMLSLFVLTGFSEPCKKTCAKINECLQSDVNQCLEACTRQEWETNWSLIEPKLGKSCDNFILGIQYDKCEKICTKTVDCDETVKSTAQNLKDYILEQRKRQKAIDECLSSCSESEWVKNWKKGESLLAKSCDEFLKQTEEFVGDCPRACKKFMTCFGEDFAKDIKSCIKECENERTNNKEKWEKDWAEIKPHLNKPCDEMMKSLMGEKKPESMPEEEKPNPKKSE